MRRFMEWLVWFIGKMCVIAGFMIVAIGGCALDSEIQNFCIIPISMVGGLLLIVIGALINRNYVG